MAKFLLFEKKLPKSFWAEAVNHAVYLLNRLPTKSVSHKTPLEAWFNVKPSARHVKIFGSICYMHIPAILRTKLDQKADMGIFVGYSTHSKGYRVYNLKTKKLIVSKDYQIDETSWWNWEKEVVVKDQWLVQQLTNIEGQDLHENTDIDNPCGDDSHMQNDTVSETEDEAQNYENEDDESDEPCYWSQMDI